MKRKLTVTFTRAIGSVTQSAPEVEIVLMAASSQMSGRTDTTYLPAPDRRVVRLNQPLIQVEFDVTPSGDPTFEEPILYRIAWRRGYLGKMESHDFYMPNRDTSLEDLLTLGSTESSEALTEHDLGVPGRVARLAINGRVLDGFGDSLYSRGEIDLQFQESEELRAREDAGIIQHVNTSITNLLSTVDTTVRREVVDSESRTSQALAQQRTFLTNADAALKEELLQKISESETSVPDDLVLILENKADLENGKVKLEQLPDDLAQGELIEVASNDRLTTTVARRGDIVVSPTDAWYLRGDDYTVLESWVRVSTLLTGVTRVNGNSGPHVTITAEDIGARPVGPIPISDLTGLGMRFREELDGVLWEDEEGYLDTERLRSDVPRLDGTTLIDSEGNVIPTAGDVTSVNGAKGEVVITPASIGARSTSTPLTISDTTGLQSNLNLKVNVSDTRLSDSRTPLTHADSHAVDGSDPITITMSQVTQLPTELSNRATKAEFEAFRQEIYADLPDNPEQQANAAREYAAMSLTAAENSADRQEQVVIYLNEVNDKFTQFENDTSDYSQYYSQISAMKGEIDLVKESVDTSRSVIEGVGDVVGQSASSVSSDRVLAEEAASLSILVAELMGHSPPGDSGSTGVSSLKESSEFPGLFDIVVPEDEE